MSRLFAISCCALFAVAGGIFARADVSPEVLHSEKERIEVLKRATAATIAVFGPAGGGGGSGVVITPDGYALTNFHVAQPSGNWMKCGMSDGKLYDAIIVGIDPTGDVALIKLLGRKDFPAAELADSDKVRAGDWAFAIGNPFLFATDYTPSVSYGLVSGVHRYQYPAGTLLEYTDCIQTDAAINPGNSGGPLFDTKGRVIGINGRGSFEKRGRVNVGVGYAISINQIKHFMGYLKSGRVVDHATLGAIVTSDEDGRVVVNDILEDSDAYRRGLRFDDEIVRFGGRNIRTVNAFKNVLGIYPKGWRVPLAYRREGVTHDTLVRLSGMHREGELIEKISRRPRKRPGKQPEPKDKPDPKPKGKPKPDKKPRSIRMHKRPPMPKIVKDHFQAKTGYANYYFNQLEQRRVWQAFSKRGDFTGQTGSWILSGKTDGGGKVRLLLADNRTEVELPQYQGEADLGDELDTLRDPPGSGGFLVAMHLWRRLLVRGIDDFGELFYLGTVPALGTVSAAEPGSMLDVFVGLHGGVECRFLFEPQSGRLAALAMFGDDDSDPCEISFVDDREQDGRNIPHAIQVHHADKLFGRFMIDRIEFEEKLIK